MMLLKEHHIFFVLAIILEVDCLFAGFYVSGFHKGNVRYLVGIGEDAQAGVGRCVGFDVFIVEFHQFIAFFDFLAIFDEDFEALAVKVDRVDADVEQVFDAVGGGHSEGMFRIEDEGDGTVLRCIDYAVFRIDEESVTGHFSGKGFIRSFRKLK